VVRFVEDSLAGFGYQVARNAPYAGGYVASSYGRPRSGVHALQIEINRALYLDERRIARTEGFDLLRRNMTTLMGRLTSFDADDLRCAQAAE
jgi:N-formylglutamate deformylase